MRSSTGGLSWEADLAPLNGAPCCWGMVNKGQSQISATELNDGRVLAMLRPDAWEEAMWEVWSSDFGVSWGPLAQGHFPMYARLDAMLTTNSGATLFVLSVSLFSMVFQRIFNGFFHSN